MDLEAWINQMVKKHFAEGALLPFMYRRDAMIVMAELLAAPEGDDAFCYINMERTRRQLEAERDALKARVAELEGALDDLLDGLDANVDERCGLSNEAWNRRIERARAALSAQPASAPQDALVEAAVAVKHGANIDTMRALAVAVDDYLKERGGCEVGGCHLRTASECRDDQCGHWKERGDV